MRAAVLRARARAAAWLVVAVLALAAAPAGAWAPEGDSADAVPAGAAVRECRLDAVRDPRGAHDRGREHLARTDLPADERVALVECLLQASRILGDTGAGERLLDDMEAATRAEGLAPRLRDRGHLIAALAMQDMGRVEGALERMRTVRAQARARGDTQTEIGALISIAQTYDTQFDDGEAAIAHFDQALALLGSLDGPPGVHHAVLHFSHGYVLLRNGRHAEADAAFAVAEQIATAQDGQEMLLQRIASGRAEVVAASGRRREAVARLETILVAQQQLGDLRGEVVTRQRLARSLLGLGRPRNARTHAERSLEIAREGRMRLHERDGHELMIQVGSALGDHEAVARHAQALRDSARGSTRDQVARELARIEAAPDEVADEDAAARGPLDLGVATPVLAFALVGSAVLLLRSRRRQRQLARLGATDALTGLLNRREATRLVDSALAGRGTGGTATSLSLLVIDVDHFKQVNDQHGHVAGDLALAAIAACLREACAPGDILARWGGEEFVLFRPGGDARDALLLAERLRRRVERLPMQQPNGVRVVATISIGVSTLPLFAGTPPSLADSLRAADRAMYEAKHGGRNAWAMIRGLGDGEGVDLGGALDNPALAAAEGVIEIVASRDMPWLPLGATRRRRDGLDQAPP